LTGLEIGAAAYSPFGLSTRNVASPEGAEFYAEDEEAGSLHPRGFVLPYA